MFNRNEFNAMLARKGVTQKEFGKILGISEVTLCKKLKNDGNFNIKEISKMIEFFGKDDVMRALFSC